jgi:hypothetical protein
MSPLLIIEARHERGRARLMAGIVGLFGFRRNQLINQDSDGLAWISLGAAAFPL